MKRVYKAVGIFSSVALVAGVGSYVVLSSVQKPKAPSGPTPVAKKEQPREQPVQPVQLTLPRTTPIVALKEDYNKPESLWVVVSKDHPVSKPDYKPADLQKVTISYNTSKSAEEMSFRAVAMPQLEALFGAAKKAGHSVMFASGFRSYELQGSYFKNYAATSGEEAANRFSARPGQSEHQTGLAFDVALESRSCYLETCFADTPAGQWFAAHAHEYGFILRYPANKTDITKYQYEPWHFRYVGTELAKALHSSSLTLDEAYEHLQTTRNELLKRKIISTE